MKIEDFKLISTLPDGFNYEFFYKSNGEIRVIGTKNQTIIGYFIREGNLFPMTFVEGKNE